MPVRLSAFPKCYLDVIANGSMSVFEWIEQAKQLPAVDGLEMYQGFFASLEPSYLDSVGEAIAKAGFRMPMLCCSPDFTTSDPSRREQEQDRQCEMIRVCHQLGGPGSVCRILTGQRYPGLSWQQGREWVLACFEAVLPVAHEYNVVLGMENHYKDGFWQYPEFAQSADRFLDILNAVPDTSHFGVQYDPSNALLAGDDPVELLRQVAPRVVSMHASDRYLTGGATIEELRQVDPATGYSSLLAHGVTGQGLNDYPTIFQILKSVGYKGWISIEDGMNGMDEMAASLTFLRRMCDEYDL